jgi:hypothetical protein
MFYFYYNYPRLVGHGHQLSEQELRFEPLTFYLQNISRP